MVSKHGKPWGRVAARPSEYLIKLGGGRVVEHGPGLSVFLWPGQTVTILPTSIQRVSFVADQVTAEKVGVAVTGIAVYRIADPLLAFRMLDFSRGQRALEQLAKILRDMFIGAARRLVANMTVEQCMTRRKESIAGELIAEIQPVVGGNGRPDDETDRGWGVVIDTIEISDVRVLSETVFADLQAPYRAQLQLAARQARVEHDQRLHVRQAEAERGRREIERELARLQADAQLQAGLAEQQRQRELAEGQHALRLEQLEQQAIEAQRELEDARRLAAARLLGERESAVVQAEIDRLRAEVAAYAERQLRALDDDVSEQRIRYELVARVLPELARALAESQGEVHLTQISSDGPGQGLLAGSLAQLLAVARSAGVDLGAKGAPRAGD